MPQLKRPLTEKQLDELQKRLPVMPDKYADATMHVVIEKPVIMPDPAITQKMLLDRHQSESQLKKSASRKTSYAGGVTVLESSATPMDNMVHRDAPMINSNKMIGESEKSSPTRSVGIANQENEHNVAQQHQTN